MITTARITRKIHILGLYVGDEYLVALVVDEVGEVLEKEGGGMGLHGYRYG